MLYTKGKHNKKSKIKKLVVFRILVLIILLILIFSIIKLFSKKSVYDNSADHLSIFTNPVTKSLLSRYYTHPDLTNILENIDLYPDDLITLALNNPESLTFVSNYTDHLSYNAIETISVNENIHGFGIPLFIQWDENWGYDIYGDNFIAINGCAPTSLAMVISGLTGDTVSPKDICNYSYDNGFYVDSIGSSWALVPNVLLEFGLNCIEIPLSESAILSSLENENPVIVTVGPGTFTSWGHFLVLTGIDSNGDILINDPNSNINSSKSWDIDVFMKESKNLWSISL